MKRFTFESVDHPRQWDRYRAFWKPLIGGEYSSAAVMFETGEIMFHYAAKSDPDFRVEYPKLGVQIFSTNDKLPFQLVTTYGDEVKPTWLNHKGQQVLLADLEHKMVVGLGPLGNKLPNNFRSAQAYYSSVDATPVGAMIKVVRPSEAARDKKNREWLDEVRAVARALYKIGGEDDGIREAYPRQYLPYSVEKFTVQVSETSNDVHEYVNKLDVMTVRRIARAGAVFDRSSEPVPYLKIKG